MDSRGPRQRLQDSGRQQTGHRHVPMAMLIRVIIAKALTLDEARRTNIAKLPTLLDKGS